MTSEKCAGAISLKSLVLTVCLYVTWFIAKKGIDTNCVEYIDVVELKLISGYKSFQVLTVKVGSRVNFQLKKFVSVMFRFSTVSTRFIQTTHATVTVESNEGRNFYDILHLFFNKEINRH